ncbi:MAG: proton-conducting transporter membrane subunit, partial [Mariprofundaceae bacterium]|nr:proton-conducting transporter membrane subunit [Mariprofundaceae bacterium]
MITSTMSLHLGLGALAVSLLAAVSAVLLAGRNDAARFTVFGLLTVSAALSMISGISGLLTHASVALSLPVGLPWLPMHTRLDALGAFFLLTIGALLIAVSIYSIGYVREYTGRKGFASLGIFMGLFVAGMQGVVLADDAFTFMLFWESMSVSSYFFVTFEHEHEENRKAGYVYLVMAHVSGLLILGSFATLYASAGSFEFSVMRDASITPFRASVGFLLAAFGFGMKAGVAPMHVWLPEAHPVAPSNASSLMSGIMIKVAIFGFIRVVWDLIGVEDFHWWWGTLILLAGSSSAVTGVLLALQQHDLKRLLAYHSVENIGIILIGLGLGMIFAYYGHPVLAALGLIAGLYHTINHALFKGLLFMGAGAVLNATGTRNMEEMGGLIHRMPVTAIVFLVACVSISALPPFNGFVSEWLTFQTALLAPKLEGSLIPMLIPFSAAMLALAGALAATCFVKVYGIVFLGQPRSPS